jgi:VanZ family protein
MKKSGFKYFLPLMLWAAAIFAVSSIPNLSAPQVGITYTDKFAHFTEYFILSICASYAIHKSELWRSVFLPAVLLGVVFGASDEFHQSFVPGRSMEFLDLVADTLGAICGSTLYIAMRIGARRSSSAGTSAERPN